MKVGIVVDIKWRHNLTQILNRDILWRGKKVIGHIHKPKTMDDMSVTGKDTSLTILTY